MRGEAYARDRTWAVSVGCGARGVLLERGLTPPLAAGVPPDLLGSHTSELVSLHGVLLRQADHDQEAEVGDQARDHGSP